MKIAQANWFKVGIPFKFSIDHNLKLRRKSESIVIQIIDEKGRKGYGEGAPREYVNNETIEQTKNQFKRLVIPDILKISDIKEYSEFLKGRNTSPALIAALETASLDLFARQNVESISNYLSSQDNRNLEYSIVLPVLPLEKLDLWLDKLSAQEPSSIKYKVGHKNDKISIDKIRSAFPEISLRLDGNCAWEFDEAISKIQALSTYKIDSIEEPLKQSLKSRLPELTKHIDIPIVLDESVCNMEDAVYFTNHIEAHKFCVNLKISKMGGLFEMELIHAFLRSKNIESQLGCNVGETAILSAAARIFAQRNTLKFLEGSYAPFFMEADIAELPLHFSKGGTAKRLVEPGLGIQINESTLLKYSEEVFNKSFIN